MRFGVMLLQVEGWPAVRGWAMRAEDQGWDDLWVADHFSAVQGHPYLDGWPLLAALAAVTTRIRLGPLVSSITLRGPSQLALQAVTLDQISNGRLELGIGAGGAARDYAALGLQPWPASERHSRLVETVEVVDLMLREGLSEHAGSHYSFSGALVLPGPLQRPRPPITVAAHGPRGIELAARLGDGWNTLGRAGTEPEPPEASMAATRSQVQTLRQACAAQGREFESIRRSVLFYKPEPDPLESVSAFHELVGRYAAIGINEFIVYWPFEGAGRARREAVLERIAVEVLPGLRQKPDPADA